MVWAILNEGQNAALNELLEGNKSDRIVAVVGGAMIDDALRQILEYRLRPKEGSTDINEILFRPSGPMGNLQPKIQLGYQLYAIDKPHRNALTGLAELRNAFAHQLSLHFDDESPTISSAIKKLTLHVGKTHYPNPTSNIPKEVSIPFESDFDFRRRRDVYFVNLKLCLIWLMGDFNRHQPHSNIPN